MPLENHERYIVDNTPIGRGGFGEVYLATDILFEKQVVIKTIAASQLYGLDNIALRRQFFRESALSARLSMNCPYIVKVLDFGYDPETRAPFFVMEYVKGHDLTKMVGKFKFESLIPLCDQILEALRVAHAAGVIHSDISPDNIMWDEDAKIFKLNDFGLAKMLNSTLMSRGSISLTGGKPAFLPPADWQSGERTRYSDIYSFSITIAQLLTGQIPRWRAKGGSMVPPLAEEVLGLKSKTVTFHEFWLTELNPDGLFGRHMKDAFSFDHYRIDKNILPYLLDSIWNGKTRTVSEVRRKIMGLVHNPYPLLTPTPQK